MKKTSNCWLLDDEDEGYFCIGCAGGMEFKDRQWGGKWDWLDFAATLLGGLLGQAVQLLIIWLIIK